MAGRLGGRRLVAPRGDTTRPTTDRVREALFSILGSLEGARVLDLYAGTGALGLEAVSRGASHVVFVETARAALTSLRGNIESLQVSECCEIVAAEVTRARPVALARGPFDLVFADPPYKDLAAAARELCALDEAGALSPGGVLVLEHATRDSSPALSATLTLRSRRSYGDTTLAIYDRQST